MRLFIAALLLLPSFSFSQSETTEAAELRATPEGDWLYGCSVATWGDWLAVGNYNGGNYPGGMLGGTVEIYHWSESGWVRTQELSCPEPGLGFSFGNSVDMDEGQLIVGSQTWGQDLSNTNSPYFSTGKAYLFELNAGSWIHSVTFRPTVIDPNTGTTARARFGGAVQIEGDRLAISAYAAWAQQQNGSGMVYMYTKGNGSWQPDGLLLPNKPNPDPILGWWSGFGISLSMDGDRIAVGASLSHSGMASVWRRTTAGWQPEAYFSRPLPPTSSCNRTYGKAVALSGNRLAIGLTSQPCSGAIHPSMETIEEFSNGQWNRVQIINDAALEPGGEKAHMGAGLAMEGTLLCIGVPSMRTGTGLDGEIRLYEYVSGQYFQPRKIFKHANPSRNPFNTQLGRAIELDTERGMILAGDSIFQYDSLTAPIGWAQGAVLHFDMELGQSLTCQGTLNSTGRTSHLAVTGSLSVAADQLTLHASQIPTGEFALFLYGQPGPVVPIASGGLLCLTGGVSRMMPPGPAGQLGQRVLDIDYTVPREAANLMPGTTWAFQVWHRDHVNGQSVTGTSNAVQVMMQ